MILSRRPDIERFLGSPDPAIRAALLYGRDIGVVRERANQLAAKATARPDDPFDVSLLTDAHSGAVAKKGQVRVEVTYDSADQPYASVAAQQDAQDRAAGEAARRIELELAAWLAKPPPKPKT